MKLPALWKQSQSRKAPLLCAILIFELISCTPANADERWIALSTTAISITGNAVFNPTKITFDGRVSFPLEFVGTVAGLTYDAKNSPASLYRITKLKNPVISSGNQLCGDTAPTYMSVSKDDGIIFLTVFTGTHPPIAEHNSWCATFNYVPANDPGH